MEQGATLIAILHIVVATLLVTIVLLQDGKGGGVGGAFGGGGSQTLFGATGATSFLAKLTRGLAFVFMITCFTLALMSSHKTTRSVLDQMPAAGTSAPAAPAPAPAPAAPAAPAQNPTSPTK